MSYIMYLDGVQLPLPPAKIKTKINNRNKTISLISEGEVNILKQAGLTDISFDVTIPQVKYPFASYPNGFKGAKYFLSKFEQLKLDKQPFQFICTRFSPAGALLFKTSMTVSLEDYTIAEDAKDGFDLLVTVQLKQFRPYGAKIVQVVSTEEDVAIVEVKEERPAASAPQLKTYAVAAGDTLWHIAKQYLGDGARYLEIFDLNKDKVVTPNLIRVGQVLTLP